MIERVELEERSGHEGVMRSLFPFFRSLFHRLRDYMDGLNDRYGSRFSLQIPGKEMCSREVRLHAHYDLDYRHVRSCNDCHLKCICNVSLGDYVRFFGGHEAFPIRLGRSVNKPKYHIQYQRKTVILTDDHWVSES